MGYQTLQYSISEDPGGGPSRALKGLIARAGILKCLRARGGAGQDSPKSRHRAAPKDSTNPGTSNSLKCILFV